MSDQFNLKKFLFENKVTKNSAYANESVEEGYASREKDGKKVEGEVVYNPKTKKQDVVVGGKVKSSHDKYDDALDALHGDKSFNEDVNELGDDFWDSEKAKEQEKYGLKPGEKPHVEEDLNENEGSVDAYIEEFGGFYNSQPGDAIESAIERDVEEGYYEDDDVDYRATMDNYAENYINKLNKEFNLNLKFKGVDSPREYNYRNDYIDFQMNGSDLSRLKSEYLEDEDFLQYAKDNNIKDLTDDSYFAGAVVDYMISQDGEYFPYEVEFEVIANEKADDNESDYIPGQDDGEAPEGVDESTFQSPIAAQMMQSKAYKELQRLQQFGIITPEEFEETVAELIDKAITDNNFDEKIAADIIASVEKTGEEPEEEPTTSMAWDTSKSSKGRRMSDKEMDKVFKEEYTPGDMWYKGIDEEFVDFIQNNPLDKLDSDTLKKLGDTAEDINYHPEAALLRAMASLQASRRGKEIMGDVINLYDKLSSVSESVDEERTVHIDMEDGDKFTEKIADKKDYKGDPKKVFKKKYADKGKVKSVRINEEHIEEASSKDVIKAFYDGNSADSKAITTNGKELSTTGIGGRTIAKKDGDKFSITIDTPSSKTEQAVIKAVKKYIPSDLMENKTDYKFRLKESDETSEPEIITQLRDVVTNGYQDLKDPKTGKKMKVDSYSASAITQVYDAINQENKEKFVSKGLEGMTSIAFQVINK